MTHSQTARLELGGARPDGTRPAVVTDQGGLLVHGAIARDPVRAPGREAEPALTHDQIAFLVATAARAPSIHNTQPWKFSVRGDVIGLLADPSRKLHYVDPAGRQLMISCGGALFGLRLGLRKLGYLPAVELLPDPAHPWLVAQVEPYGRAPMNKAEAELLAALPHRHTHRGPFGPGEIPPRLLTEMRLDAGAEGGELVLVEDPARVCELAGLVSAAAEEQRARPEIAAELARWVQPLDSQARDGVPASARLAPMNDARDEDERPRLPQRDFGLPGTERGGGVPPAGAAVLVTAGDDAADWLWAGQALNRLLLRAATRWVFASLQSQPLEMPRYRWQVAKKLSLSGYPQMLLQFGRANTALATARRPKAELMTNDQQG
jgi:nitroreductase